MAIGDRFTKKDLVKKRLHHLRSFNSPWVFPLHPSRGFPAPGAGFRRDPQIIGDICSGSRKTPPAAGKRPGGGMAFTSDSIAAIAA